MPKPNRPRPLKLSKPLPTGAVSTLHAQRTLLHSPTSPVVSDFSRHSNAEFYRIHPQESDPTNVSGLFSTESSSFFSSSSSSASSSSLDLSARIVDAQEIQEIEYYHRRKRKNKGKAKQSNIPEPYEASSNSERCRDVVNKGETPYPKPMTSRISGGIEKVLKTSSSQYSPDVSANIIQNPSRGFTRSIGVLNAALIGPSIPHPMHPPIGSGRPGKSEPSIINPEPFARRPNHKVKAILGIGMEYPILAPAQQPPNSTRPNRNAKKNRLSPNIFFPKLSTRSTARSSSQSENILKAPTWVHSKEETATILAQWSLKDHNDADEDGLTEDFKPWEPLRIFRKSSAPEAAASTKLRTPPVSPSAMAVPDPSLQPPQSLNRVSSSIPEENDIPSPDHPEQRKVEELGVRLGLATHPQYTQSSVNIRPISSFNESHLIPMAHETLRSPSAPNIILSTPDDVAKMHAPLEDFEVVMSNLPANEDEIFNVSPHSSTSEETLPYQNSSGKYSFYKPQLTVQTSWYNHDQDTIEMVNKQRKQELVHFSEILEHGSPAGKSFRDLHRADVGKPPEVTPATPEKISPSFRPNSRWSDYSGDSDDGNNWRSSVMAHIKLPHMSSRLHIRKPISMAKKNFKKMTSSSSLKTRSSTSSTGLGGAIRSSADSSTFPADASKTNSVTGLSYASIAATSITGSPRRELSTHDKRASDVPSLQSPGTEKKSLNMFVEAVGRVARGGGEKKAEKRREELKKMIRVVGPGPNGVAAPGRSDWI